MAWKSPEAGELGFVTTLGRGSPANWSAFPMYASSQNWAGKIALHTAFWFGLFPHDARSEATGDFQAIT